MKIIAITMVKNEQDIIEPFVRHNLQYVDRVYVLDHFSNDQTPVLLNRMRDEGLAVLPLHADQRLRAGAYLQSEIMTQLFVYVHDREKQGGYLFLDADEFLDHPDGRRGLEWEFESVNHSEIIYVPWRTHVIPVDAAESYLLDPPRSFTHRRAHENPEIFKAMLRIDANRRTPKLGVAQGNHETISRSTLAGSAVKRVLGLKSYRNLPGSKSRKLALRHYPVRSSEQIFQKAVLGWLSTLQKYPSARAQQINSQWRVIFDELLSMESIDIRRLHEVSVSYAQTGNDCDVIYDDSIQFEYNRKYKMQTIPQFTLVLQELERRAIAQGYIANSFWGQFSKMLTRLRSRLQPNTARFMDNSG